MANNISRTMKITKAQVEGFNREAQRAETKAVTLFTEPEGELEILAAVTTTQFIAFRAASIETKEEQREMSVADFYRQSKPAGTVKGKKISRTMKITKAQVEGFNRAEQRAETRGVTLFTEPEGELEILAAVTTTQFIAFRAASIETKEEQREMSVADFYRKSKPVAKKEAKEEKEEKAE